MTKKEINERKAKLLIAMNEIVTCLNDETAYYEGWIWLIPDEADEEELTDIATDDDSDIFDIACGLFTRLVKRYGKDGYCVGEGKAYGIKKEATQS